MTRRTLIDFFSDLSATSGDFLTYDDGYRTWSYSYADVARAAHAFAARLRSAAVAKGQSVAIWSENRPEWIIAFWGCLLEGVVLVPIDYRTSAAFLTRVAEIVDARAILVGDVVDRASLDGARPIWSLSDLRAPHEPGGDVTAAAAPAITADDTAEIIFTSGATADPKGVVITHRNVLANIVPIEREMQKYKHYAKPFLPVRFLNLLPLSHMFGQAMATFVPPMLPGLVVFTRSYSPDDIVRADPRAPHLGARLRAEDARSAARSRAAVCRRMRPSHSPGKMHWAMRWWKYRERASAVRVQVLGVRGRRGAARSGAGSVLGSARVSGRPGLRAHRDGADCHAESPVPCGARRSRQADHRRGGEDRRRRRDPRARRERHPRLFQRAGGDAHRRSATAGSIPATSASSTTKASCTSAAARRR